MLSDKTKQSVKDILGITWDEFLKNKIPKVKKTPKIMVYKYRKIKKRCLNIS